MTNQLGQLHDIELRLQALGSDAVDHVDLQRELRQLKRQFHTLLLVVRLMSQTGRG
jgi:hypothetical protein